jgi:hypothetical protein
VQLSLSLNALTPLPNSPEKICWYRTHGTDDLSGVLCEEGAGHGQDPIEDYQPSDYLSANLA